MDFEIGIAIGDSIDTKELEWGVRIGFYDNCNNGLGSDIRMSNRELGLGIGSHEFMFLCVLEFVDTSKNKICTFVLTEDSLNATVGAFIFSWKLDIHKKQCSANVHSSS